MNEQDFIIPVDLDLYRDILLWQEGLICQLCKAGELVTPEEIYMQTCSPCRQELKDVVKKYQELNA